MKYYICPYCGELRTEEEIDKMIESGGMAFCYCQWTPDNRILIEYEEIPENVYNNLLPLKKGREKGNYPLLIQ